MKRILSLLVCLLLFGFYAAFGQDIQIKGTVTASEDGSPLPGVYILIKGTNNGVATDVNGKYQMTVPSNVTLVFSSVGYKSQEVTLAGQSVLDVVMEAETVNLDEVVVTALGIKREKREVTYQTQKVSDDEILKTAPTRAATALTGKVAGLQINSQDNGVNPSTQITLRGFRSISGTNDATVVIDGSIASIGALDDLNPNDIADINILKGANAAALYGSKASNGALIVTTKKGATNQKFTVGITSAYTVEKVAYMPDFQSEYGTGWEGAYDAIENTNWGPRFDGTMRQIGPTFADGSYQEVPYAPVKNNLLDFFESGDTWTNTAYVSGGDQTSTFYISAGQQSSDGIVPEDAYKRYTFRANASKRLGKLELAFNATYFSDHTDVVGNTIGDQDRPLYWFLLNTSANIPLSRYKNWRTDLYATPDTYYNGYYENPYWGVGTNRNIDDTRRLTGNIAVSYDILSWMKLTGRAAMNNSWGNGKNWRAAQEFDPVLQPSHSAVSSFVEDSEFQYKDYNFDAILAIDRDITDMVSLKANLGATNQTRQTRSSQIRANNLSIPDFYDVSNGTGTPEVDVTESEYINYGFFGDFTVGYGNYLFLNFSGRNDWTSTLEKGNNSYFYPAFGLSFVITDAFKGLQNNILSFAKITASNSTVFNDLDPYAINERYSQQTGFPYGDLNGFALSTTTVDANIKKEKINTTELGIDLGFLNNRITFDASYYMTSTTDLITTITPSIASGAASFLTNIGELQNNGFEATLGGRVLEIAGFTWDLSFNYTTTTTKVVEITKDINEVTLVTGGGGLYGVYAIVDEVYPQIKASAYERDPQGRLIVDPSSGAPIETAALKKLGRTIPKHILGTNTTLAYKGISVSATLDYRTGHVYYEQGSDQMEFTGRSLESVSANRQDFVIPNSVIETSPGVYVPNTDIPVSGGRQSYWTDVYNNVKENYVKDASAVKIRELAIDYTLPTKLLSKTPITKVKVGFIARNLMTWLPKENHFADPEFANSYTNSNAIGIGGYLQSPPTRSFGFSLNLEF
jgi:TonB-linked SusC/RagA family outer membrane protein